MSTETVIILHGIFRSNYHMRKLAAYVQKEGYEVLNLNYPSTRYPLEELIELTWKDISSRYNPSQLTHFIGYSMGGLLVRGILSKYRPTKLGRAVLLAPPNKGSEVADFLKNIWLYKTLYGPAGQQLTTDQTSIRHLFSPLDYECGVIAGSLSLDPFSSLLIKGKDDGKVSIESTKVEGMKEHIVISSTHTWFPHNKEVQRQALHFIRNGCFETPSKPL